MNVPNALNLTVSTMNDKPKQTITIKKYANRRLYNTATSSYVTLETLAGMVKEGVEFNVYDAKTSEDITRSVLQQIIFEEEGKSDQQNLLPISFMRQLIGFYGNNMQWLVPKYLEHSMEVLSKNQDELTSYFQKAFGNMFPFSSTLGEVSKQNLALFENAMRLFSPFIPPVADVSPKQPPHTASYEAPATTKPGASPFEEPLATVTPLTRKPESAPVVQPEPKPQTVVEACVILPKPEPIVETAAEPAMEKPVKETTLALSSQEPALPPEPVAAVAPAIAASAPIPATSTPPTAAAPTPISMPTPNLQSATASAAPTADDMQQKIANLQRQLAELAKNRA